MECCKVLFVLRPVYQFYSEDDMEQWRKEIVGWRDNNKILDFNPKSKQGKDISKHMKAANKEIQGLIAKER